MVVAIALAVLYVVTVAVLYKAAALIRRQIEAAEAGPETIGPHLDALLAKLLARRAAEAMLDELLFWHVGQWFRRGDDPDQAGVPTWDGRQVDEAVDRAVRKVVEEVTRRG